MTWSIVARDPASAALGIIVTSKFFAAGAICPYARGEVGAVCTQAFVNPTYGPRGLDLMRDGVPASEALDRMIQADDGRDHRQIHLIDAAGANAAWTGSECLAWCGHRVATGYLVAGNLLAGPEVVEQSFAAFGAAGARPAAGGPPFAQRLIDAMDAGQAAGGDRRGRQSAGLLIYAGEAYAQLDLRVDDHPNPLVELRRLYEESQREYTPFLALLPTKASPAGTFAPEAVAEVIERQRRNQAARDG